MVTTLYGEAFSFFSPSGLSFRTLYVHFEPNVAESRATDIRMEDLAVLLYK
jgi:hypothetical protein